MARQGNSRSTSVPAPVGGWDTRNALADMPVQNAVILDNFFPETDAVTLRRGNSSHATGLPAAGESLIPYMPLDGVGEMYAAAGGGIYDVTAAGAVGAAVVGSLTNNRWQHVQMATAGGNFTLAFNGADTPLLYDGTTWGNTAITGLTQSELIWANIHQRRLWVGGVDSLDAWYLAVNSIAGAATKFPLGGIAKRGGYLMGMGTWTRDAGDGTDDVAVFLTSEGEAIIYSGTDPADASTWSLIGVFTIGRPIGRRCMQKAGADLVMVTQDGFVTAASILQTDRSQADKVALSAQINSEVNNSVRLYGSLFGWEPFLYPRGSMLLFNIPQSSTTFVQYVFNTITGAPCRFTGINARCFGLIGDTAYWCGDGGVVFKFDDGLTDNGAAIAGDALQAFSYFGDKANRKAFKMVDVIMRSDGTPNIATDLNTDFQIQAPSSAPVASPTAAGLWDVGLWDVATWGADGQIFSGWRGVRGIGRAASLRVRTSSLTSRPSWVSTNFLYVTGGQM